MTYAAPLPYDQFPEHLRVIDRALAEGDDLKTKLLEVICEVAEQFRSTHQSWDTSDAYHKLVGGSILYERMRKDPQGAAEIVTLIEEALRKMREAL